MGMETKLAAWEALQRAYTQGVAEFFPAETGNIVNGEGCLDAPLVLVGEAPGAQETLEKRPFVGKAGQNLDVFLHTLGLHRESLYITNVVKFRPKKVHPRTGSISNRPPTSREVRWFSPFLHRELEVVSPRLVITLGNTALHAVTGDAGSTIGNCHGQCLPLAFGAGSMQLFALYHPASIIYAPQLQQVYSHDVEILKKLLNNGHFVK